jgi:hypothetical protein
VGAAEEPRNESNLAIGRKEGRNEARMEHQEGRAGWKDSQEGMGEMRKEEERIEHQEGKRENSTSGRKEEWKEGRKKRKGGWK